MGPDKIEKLCLRAQQAIADNFTGIPPRTARRILCDNAKALYGL